VESAESHPTVSPSAEVVLQQSVMAGAMHPQRTHRTDLAYPGLRTLVGTVSRRQATFYVRKEGERNAPLFFEWTRFFGRSVELCDVCIESLADSVLRPFFHFLTRLSLRLRFFIREQSLEAELRSYVFFLVLLVLSSGPLSKIQRTNFRFLLVMQADCIGKFKAGTSGASIVTEGLFIELPSFIVFFVSALAARNRTFHATGEGVFLNLHLLLLLRTA
jgi:hypothetical protein